jgi:hypothetical protein
MTETSIKNLCHIKLSFLCTVLLVSLESASAKQIEGHPEVMLLQKHGNLLYAKVSWRRSIGAKRRDEVLIDSFINS